MKSEAGICELVIHNLRDAVLVLDLDDRVIAINPPMQVLCRQSAEQVRGKEVREVFAAQPDLLVHLTAAKKLPVMLKLYRVGAWRDYELLVSLLTNRQSEPVARLVMLRDITRQQQDLAQLEHYYAENTRLLAEEHRLRQMAESLLQTMMSISSNLDSDAIVDAILTQLQVVLPYYTAALYLAEQHEVKLERVVGPEAVSGKSYTTPRRLEQILQVLDHRQAQIFVSAHSQRRPKANHEAEPVYCSMAAPLLDGPQTLGVLTIDRFDVQPFVQAEAEILQAFANQAAIAVKNARLYQQAQDLAALEERDRLAQELHDAVNQTLFTASILAEAVPEIWERDPEQGRHGLDEIRQLTRAALAEMRTLLLELRPQALIEKPLGDLLSQLVRAFSGRTRIPVDFEILCDAILPPDLQVALYRITQEALNNTFRHAQAGRVNVQLRADPREVSLIIQDDGIGFEIDEVPPDHLGLAIMRARAEKVQADLLLISQPGEGTRIEVAWSAEGSPYERQ